VWKVGSSSTEYGIGWSAILIGETLLLRCPPNQRMRIGVASPKRNGRSAGEGKLDNDVTIVATVALASVGERMNAKAL
jgi:hypothetical protein